ncbi:MAG: FAD-binding protein, partial [Cytophagales bacterium]|nr:FAD-binding protein [Cytophaga sp.]
MERKKRFTWSNSIGRESSTPLLYAIPETLEDICTIIKEAEAGKLKVRAVGAGHSFNDIAITQDYMLSMEKLTNVQRVDKNLLRQKWKDYLGNIGDVNKNKQEFIEIESGIRLRALNATLDKDFGLALCNMGGIDHQSISGVVSTGTHGTGINLPAFPGMVRALTLVAAGGKAYHIEPEDGITDPSLYSNSKIILIQDDEIFHSVILGLGAMGIIYSIVLEVRPVHWMEEVKTLCKWSELKQELLNGSIFNDYKDPEYVKKGLNPLRKVRGIMFQINPYTTKDDHTCILVRHMDLDERGKLGLFDRIRNPLSGILSTRMFSAITYKVTLSLLNRRSKGTPKSIDGALKGLKDKRYINRCYKVLYQGFVYIKERAYDCEFAFDRTTDNHVNAIDAICAKAEEMKDKYDLYQTSPLGMRFVKQSKAYLSPEYQKEAAYIDTPFLTETKATDTMLEDYQQIMLKHGGVPHWGKINSI